MNPTLVLAATTLVALYASACWALPFGKCHRCKGDGSHPRLITRRHRTCKRCKGSGLRLRYGRAAYNFLAAIHHDATHTRPATGTPAAHVPGKPRQMPSPWEDQA